MINFNHKRLTLVFWSILLVSICTGQSVNIARSADSMQIGDINGDGEITIGDVILSLKAGSDADITGESIFISSDVNGDSRIGMPEAIYGMQKVAAVAAAGRIVINEFMAANDNSIIDEDGDSSDWIELYNAGNDAINLSGWVLTDESGNRWTFPSITLNPGDYIVVFASGKDRIPDTVTVVDGISNLHTNFQLAQAGEYLSLESPDGIIHPFNLLASGYPQQATDLSYGRYAGGEGLRYHGNPTPGIQNSSSNVYEGLVTDTTFSVDRGFYTDAFQLAIATTTDGAEIRYTLDGSDPEADHGTIYSEPVQISKTSSIRAAAFKTGWRPTNIDTHTYIFIADVIIQSPEGAAPNEDWPTDPINDQVFDYGMDPDVVGDPRYADLIDDALLSLPAISLVTDLDHLFNSETGIYVNAVHDGADWERPVSVELINPDGSDGFQVDAGVRIRGGYSRQPFNPKHAFRLFFRDRYGSGKLRFPLFGDEGADQFDKIDLRTAMNYSWSFGGNPLNTMVRDVFNRDTQRDMGQPYTRSRYYHLYINGHYWGIYQTQERSEARYAATYFGGSKDDYDVVKVDSGLTFDAEGLITWKSYMMTATDGNVDAWHRLWEEGNARFRSDEAYYRVQGLNTDGTSNVSYEKLLDIDNLIDYELIIFYGGNIDSPVSRFGSDWGPNNIYVVYNRENPDGFKSFIHDAEHSMLIGNLHGYGDELYTDRTGPFPAGNDRNYSNPQWLHQRLAVHPEYRMRFADRAHRYFFNNGLLTPDVSKARFMSRANEIDLAIIAESARWGDANADPARTKHDDWLPAISDIVDTWMPMRPSIVLDQLREKAWYPSIEAPVFSINGTYQHGGQITSGDTLTIDNTNESGTVYYTLDGSDPRQTGTYENTSIAAVTETASKRVKIPADGRALFEDGEFAVTYYKATIPVTDVGTAYWQVIRNEDNQSEVVSDTADVVNFLNTGNTGRFAGDLPFPGTTIGEDLDDFVVEVTATVFIPAAGEWTFGVNCDDGFYLDAGGQVMSRGGALEDAYNTFYYPAPGAHYVYMFFHERAGAARLELFAASGRHEAWDEADFQLVGDTDNGGLRIVGASWTSVDFNDALWTTGTGGVGYDRDVSCPGGANCYDADFDIDVDAEMFSANSAALIRIPFMLADGEPYDFTNLMLKLKYDDGFVAYLNGTEVARANAPDILTWNAAATGQHADTEAMAWQEFQISDHIINLHSGENILAIFGLNISVTSSDFLISAELEAQKLVGTAPVASAATAYIGGISLSGTTQVSSRILDGDTWSALNVATFYEHELVPVDRSIVINEVLSHSHNEDPDWIELYNTTEKDYDISGWFLSDDADNLMKYEIAPNTLLHAGSYIVFCEESVFAFCVDPPFGSAFALSENGETVYLSSGLNGSLTGYDEQEDFGAAESNVTFGRYEKSTRTFNFVAMSENTPGAANAYPKVGPVVISEIMYNPVSVDDLDEYIEIVNITDEPVLLEAYDTDKDETVPWQFVDGISYTFPLGTAVPAGGYILIVKDPASFAAAHTIPEGVSVFGPFEGNTSLSNGGEKVEIAMPGDVNAQGDRQYIRIDRVNYDDIAPWPTAPDGTGMSLTRIQLDQYGNDPANWQAASPTPGY